MYRLKEYKDSDLPDAPEAAAKAAEFANSIESNWKQSTKKYPLDVTVYTTWSGGDFWAARVSHHLNLSYAAARSGLMENHTANEAEYIDVVTGFDVLDAPQGWTSAAVHYDLGKLLSPRVMSIWVAALETRKDEEFVVVTLPRLSGHQSAVKGLYVSVEVVRREGDGIKWTMATTSDAGGWIPQWLQRLKVGDELPKDVPQFISWINGKLA